LNAVELARFERLTSENLLASLLAGREGRNFSGRILLFGHYRIAVPRGRRVVRTRSHGISFKK